MNRKEGVERKGGKEKGSWRGKGRERKREKKARGPQAER